MLSVNSSSAGGDSRYIHLFHFITEDYLFRSVVEKMRPIALGTPLAVLLCAASFLACFAQSPMFAPCTYTSADGSYFDLSPLTRYNAAQDYAMADAAGNSYIMNVRLSHCAPPFPRVTPCPGLWRCYGCTNCMRRFGKDCPCPCLPGFTNLFSSHLALLFCC